MKSFLKYSKLLGQSLYFVQGGGGNSSVKIGNKIYIKASGHELKDIKHKTGYVCLNLTIAKKFIHNNPNYSKKIEKKFDQATLENIYPKESFGKPSMETAFHVVLPEKYILHPHHVLANVFNCMLGGEKILKNIFRKERVTFIPYAHPGYDLACAIRKKSKANIFFLKNHGLITQSSTAEGSYILVELVQKKIKEYLIKNKVFSELKYAEQKAGFKKHLFPDSVVYSSGNFSKFSEKQKRIYFETVSVNNYILKTISKLGKKPTFLNKKAVEFLKNTEKEKFRIKQIIK